MINKQDNREPTTAQTLMEDLTVNKEHAAGVKGGPIEIRELHIKVNVDQE
jgi:hypothetical protein